MKNIFTIILILFLSACNDYELQKVGKHTLLLNKNKGDVSIIDKGMVVQLPKYSLSLEKRLSSDGFFEDKLQVTIKSKVTFDRVFYKMTLEGKETTDQAGIVSQEDFGWFKPAMEKNKGNFITLKYQDKDEYPLFEKKLNLNNFSYNSTNYQGIKTGLVYEGSFSVKPHISNKANNLSYVYVMQALEQLKK